MPDTKRQRLKEKIDTLPPALVGKVDDFVGFAAAKKRRSGRRALRQDWAGGVRSLGSEYTSVELKKKAFEWWGGDAWPRDVWSIRAFGWDASWIRTGSKR